jgi:opacity protein-like surface antigen
MLVSRFATAASLALVTLFGVTAASAADYAPPPPVVVQPPQECCSNWYLRGFVGVGMNSKPDLEYQQNPANSSNFGFDYSSIGDAYFIGGGIGYYWNEWLRFDVTAEYRAKARVYAFGHYTDGGGYFLDTYEGNLKSWVILANAYVDLGTWYCLTPFVGFGIGGAYNTLADFSDVNPSLAGWGVGRNPSKWNVAWALYAGLAYNVNKNFKVELSYRYLNYGEITDTVDCAGGCNPDSYKFGNLHSNDIMLSLRWNCCDLPPEQPRYYAPPPPAYQPPPTYAPPPAYQPPASQPPLRSRG